MGANWAKLLVAKNKATASALSKAEAATKAGRKLPSKLSDTERAYEVSVLSSLARVIQSDAEGAWPEDPLDKIIKKIRSDNKWDVEKCMSMIDRSVKVHLGSPDYDEYIKKLNTKKSTIGLKSIGADTTL